MFRLFWKIWLRVFGWKFVGTFPQELKKCVIAVAPHTSNWDVVVGMATRSVMPIRGAKFLGKQELFRGILGPFMRWIGGVPVDRSKKSNTVEQVAEACRKSERFILAIAPEGTRKRVDSLKTGFWHMAKAAGIPIVLAGLDYKHKAVVFPNHSTRRTKRKISNASTPSSPVSKAGIPNLGLDTWLDR